VCVCVCEEDVLFLRVSIPYLSISTGNLKKNSRAKMI
jgi:hypothetical protein